jgi:hypothetical protein
MSQPVVLAVGEEFHLKCEKDCVVYAGMTSEKVYSIVQRNVAGMALSGQRFAWNLFFPSRQARYNDRGSQYHCG